MIFYSWTALSESDQTVLSESDRTALSESESRSCETLVAMGISDDRGRAMKAGEETLGSGRAVVVIIEAVRPAMAAQTLAPCYVRTGVGWRGRCTEAGDVAWSRFFVRADPDDRQAPGTMGP